MKPGYTDPRKLIEREFAYLPIPAIINRFNIHGYRSVKHGPVKFTAAQLGEIIIRDFLYLEKAISKFFLCVLIILVRRAVPRGEVPTSV
jgi:hypothetical protein